MFLDETYNLKIRENELISSINWERLPGHVAIIMDGNGRWATQQDLPRIEGHQAGVEALRKVVQHCSDFNLEVLTVYAFSTENWRRPSEEVNFLLKLPQKYLEEDLQTMHENNIKVTASGLVDELPSDAREAIHKSMKTTFYNTGLTFNMAVNYGGRPDIVHAVRNIAQKVQEGSLLLDDINEETFSQHLLTGELPDPELIIRTSGELRISNFLLWQAAYAEFYFTPVLWPDFDKLHLLEAIYEFQKRKRRFGGLEAE